MFRMALTFLGLAALGCAATGAAATTFHVDPLQGSDSAGDGSAASPWASLRHVFAEKLVESRDWDHFPWDGNAVLVPINAGAPIRAGDTILLHTGDYGSVTIARLYNEAPITIAAAPGAVPRLEKLSMYSVQNWRISGLHVSPGAPLPDGATRDYIVKVNNHNHFGPSRQIELRDLDVYTVDDAAGWGAQEWIRAWHGVQIRGSSSRGQQDIALLDSRIRNSRYGLAVEGPAVTVRGNLIDGFSGDGIRGLGNDAVYEYNIVRNAMIDDAHGDGNHDDGFQSWSRGTDGVVGHGVVSNVVLRGNIFISTTDPGNPLAQRAMQGIGCFDGMFQDWMVENNLVVTGASGYHGISFYGMLDSRLVNNTIVALDGDGSVYPWLGIFKQKSGQGGAPSANVVIRNNLVPRLNLSSETVNLVEDHNLVYANGSEHFVAPPLDARLRAGSAAIDAGSSVLAPAEDLGGFPRPHGAGYDIGAWEWRGDLIFADGFDAASGGA